MQTALSVLQKFREIDPEMVVHQAEAFLLVALRPGITIGEVGERLGFGQSTASRTVAALGTRRRIGSKKPPLGLIDQQEDPEDFRRKTLTLTAKGKRVASSLSS